MSKFSNIEKLSPIFAVIWIMSVMNTVIAWYSFSIILFIVGALGVIFCSKVMEQHVITKGRQLTLVFVILYVAWEILNRGSLGKIFTLFFTFVPLPYILFWPSEHLKKTYEIFRKIALFFAVGSSIVVILYYLGILPMIPHYELSPLSYLHSNRGDTFEIYFVFPQLVSNDIFRRACGFSLEPGHFSIVLGFIYLIDRYLQIKINPVIIIGAILAFSPAFFLTVLFVELFNIRKYFKKAILFFFILISASIIVYNLLPQNMQETVYYLGYERNVENLIDSYGETGSIDETLDKRTNQLGRDVYNNMSFGQKLVGGEGDEDIVLSDYRGFIVSKGLISFVFVVLISFFSFSGATLSLKLSLFLTMFMIMLHRAWFFYEPFPYFMSFVASACYCYKKSNMLDDFVEKIASPYSNDYANEINADTVFKELDEWSSLRASSIIEMADRDYMVTLNVDDIQNASTIEDLYNIVKSKD